MRARPGTIIGLTDLSEVRVVDMSNNMEQQFLDLLQHDVEVGRKLIAVFGGEDGFVVDNLLYVGHHIVHILGGRDLAFLPLVIHPHVIPGQSIINILAEVGSLPYLGPGPTISGQEVRLQNSETVPYSRLMCSKKPMAAMKDEDEMTWLSYEDDTYCGARATHWHPDQREPP